LCFAPSTIDHRPSTIDHRPSTIDHRPSTIDHRPSTNPVRQNRGLRLLGIRSARRCDLRRRRARQSTKLVAGSELRLPAECSGVANTDSIFAVRVILTHTQLSACDHSEIAMTLMRPPSFD
jgi:hypothetical protein